MAVPTVTRSSGSELMLGFRFGVFFFSLSGGQNPIDCRFQKVSGLSASVKTTPLLEGGQNLYTQQLPSGVEFGRLVLERGMVRSSPLHADFTSALMLYQFKPANVMVTLYDELATPISGWLFNRAFPTKWSTSDLDANDRKLIIDKLELTYAHMQILRL